MLPAISCKQRARNVLLLHDFEHSYPSVLISPSSSMVTVSSVQIMAILSSVGAKLPLPLIPCLAAIGSPVDHWCSIIVEDDHRASTNGIPMAGWSVGFKAAIDPSCSLAGVDSGLCSACSAASAVEGLCPPGVHTCITNVVTPDGSPSDTSLDITLHVGASILSAKVIVRFEVVTDTQGHGSASQMSARLQEMLVASRVCQRGRTHSMHGYVPFCR